MQSTCSLSVVIFSVMDLDPHHIEADPDSTYHSDADSDILFDADSVPTFHPDADTNPDPSFKKKAQTLEKS
jgi:hypothetical protein